MPAYLNDLSVSLDLVHPKACSSSDPDRIKFMNWTQ